MNNLQQIEDDLKNVSAQVEKTAEVFGVSAGKMCVIAGVIIAVIVTFVLSSVAKFLGF